MKEDRADEELKITNVKSQDDRTSIFINIQLHLFPGLALVKAFTI